MEIGGTPEVNHTVRQTVVADDGNPEDQRAYFQSDWTEF